MPGIPLGAMCREMEVTMIDGYCDIDVFRVTPKMVEEFWEPKVVLDRVLYQLETAGLISVTNPPDTPPLVTLLSYPS